MLAAVPVAVVFLWIYGIGLAKHEPGLFFPHAPAAAVHFAEALLRRL